VPAEAKSTNPLVQAIVAGSAPTAARLAAARGMLPLSQTELLEALVHLRGDGDQKIAQAAQSTLAEQRPEDLLPVARDNDVAPSVLGYLACLRDGSRDLHEAVASHRDTPDEAIALLAGATVHGQLLELITLNQQRLIRAPAIIDAVLANPARTPEAERRAKETRQEFFEKERGAKQVAQELRSRGNSAAAEFFESAETTTLSSDDAWLLAQHIEVSDVDLDDSWLAREMIEEMLVETPEQAAANVQAVIAAERLETADVPSERVSLIRRLMFMTVKDRVKFAIKGDREARGILIRDSNKVVAAAVIHNPRITEKEIENIAALRTVSEEVLRLIGLNRAWTRSYSIIHNLARNPRTPFATSMGLLTRIQTKDLKALADNRNVSENVRRQAYRLVQSRRS
jgi:hypothetical protein